MTYPHAPLSLQSLQQFIDSASAEELRAALLGLVEYRLDCTADPGDDLVEAYDLGRELAHQITDHQWDLDGSHGGPDR